jgi:radical SAM superfamily enzyme YgiQ (UPF0313 family)
MNILLIHPKMNHGPVTDKDRGTIQAKLMAKPELTLPAVAACIPKTHNIRIIHENHENIDYSNEYDLVGISCFTLFAPQVYEIADKFRKMGIPVVLGGYHATAMPKEAKQHADSIVMGEAELSFPKLLKDLENEKIKPFYSSKKLVKPEEIPPLRRDLLNFRGFSDAIRITRGCPNKCEFCSITNFFKHSYRKRPIKNVIKEFKSVPQKIINIHDANLTADLDYSKELFKEMIRKKVNKIWLGNGNIYVLGRDEEFLKLAKKSGCVCWTIGFESISQKSLNGVKKLKNKVEKYAEWIDTIKKHGMAINALFMFGFDQDTPEVFDATIDALNEWEIDAAEFNILTPLPGTPVYKKMDKEGRILTKDWSKYTQTQVVFQPKNMSPEELYEGMKKVTKEFHATDKMIKRCIRFLKISLHPTVISIIVSLNMSQKIWYKREFGI